MSRFLLFTLGLVAMLVSASSSFADPAEDAAAKAVEKFGGTVGRDKKVKGAPVTGIYLSNSTITDAGLKQLAGLKNATMLNLSESAKITDAGLKNLAALKSLTDLRLEKVPLTDEGVKTLASLSLTSLSLNGTGITDAAAKDLAACKNLQKLQLANTRLTDAGLKELGALNGLTFLDVSGSSVTGAGIKVFKKSVPKCKVVGP